MENKSRITLYPLTLLFAFCSLAYETLVSKALTELTNNAVLSQSLSLGVFLAAIGFGSQFFKRFKNPNVTLLLRIELLLSVIGSLSVYIVFITYFYFKSYFIENIDDLKEGNQVLIFVIVNQGIIFVLGFLSGFELPALFELSKSSTGSKEYSKILGFNYLGALLGAITLPTLLFNRYSIFELSLLVGFINLIGALLLVLKFDRTSARSYATTKILVGTLLLGGMVLISGSFKRYYLKFEYSQSTLSEMSLFQHKNLFSILSKMGDIQRIHSHYQFIDIVPDQFFELSDRSAHFSLYLDGNLQFRSKIEQYYHEVMAHAPAVIYNHSPKNPLILGGGDGLLVKELLRRPEVESITLVELDPKMIELASYDPRFLLLNRSSLHHEKVNTIVQDAFVFMKNASTKYDAIYIDFPFPANFELSKLYSIEFYQLVINRLAPEGFVIFDYPLMGKSELTRANSQERNDIIFSTLSYAGAKDIHCYGADDRFISFRKVDSQTDIAKLDLRHVKYISSSVHNKLEFLSNIVSEAKIEKQFVNSIFKPKVSLWNTHFH